MGQGGEGRRRILLLMSLVNVVAGCGLNVVFWCAVCVVAIWFWSNIILLCFFFHQALAHSRTICSSFMHLTSAFPFFVLLHSLLSSDQQKIVQMQEQGVSLVSQKGKRRSQHLFYLFENNLSTLYAHMIVHPTTSFSSLFSTPQESEVTHSSGWLPDMSKKLPQLSNYWWFQEQQLVYHGNVGVILLLPKAQTRLITQQDTTSSHYDKDDSHECALFVEEDVDGLL